MSEPVIEKYGINFEERAKQILSTEPILAAKDLEVQFTLRGEKLNAMGLQFGLWFEPESVSPDSALYRQHPDWALHDVLGREDLLGRHQLLLDLTKPEVRNYLVESVGALLKEHEQEGGQHHIDRVEFCKP